MDWIDEHLASRVADHAARRAGVRDVYGPRLAQLGIKPRADDSDDDRLLRAALINELADFGQDSALRDALAVGGRKVLGLDTDGTLNPDAVSPDQRGLALRMAAVQGDRAVFEAMAKARSEEHTSELQSLMRNSYAVSCLKKKNK